MFEVLKGHTGSCQRRTCLKWEINGELSALDRKKPDAAVVSSPQTSLHRRCLPRFRRRPRLKLIDASISTSDRPFVKAPWRSCIPSCTKATTV